MQSQQGQQPLQYQQPQYAQPLQYPQQQLQYPQQPMPSAYPINQNASYFVQSQQLQNAQQPMLSAYPINQNTMPFIQQQSNSQNNTTKRSSLIKILIISIISIGLIILLIYLFGKNGKLSEWSEYTKCSKECGGGTQIRTRTYTKPAWGGRDDINKDKLTETVNCNTELCKIDGKMSDWKDGKCQISELNPIQITCGTGKKEQTRTYIPASNKGKDLDTKDPERLLISQWTECKLDPCSNADDSYTEWTNSDVCVSSQTDLTPKTCGDGGTQKQTRKYIPPKGTGKKTKDENNLTQWIPCRDLLPQCPTRTDGSCTTWRNDGECECTANGINQRKQIRIYTAPSNGGSPPPAGCDSTVIKYERCNEPCPKDPIFVDFVDQSNDRCLPKIGKDRFKFSKGKYTFPINKSHSSFIATNFNSTQIETIKNLTYDKSIEFEASIRKFLVKFTRINNTIPEEYELEKKIRCDNIEILTEEKIKEIWNNQIGCTGDFKNNDLFLSINSNLEDLKYMETGDDIIRKFSKFSKPNLLLNPNYANTKLCYPDNYLTFTKTDNYVASDKFLPGFIANNADGNIQILKKDDFELVFQADGNLILQTDTAIYWASNTSGQNIKLLTMQNDGNLTMANVIGQRWFTDTYGNPGAYLQLTSFGDLNIVNPTNNNIIRTIYKNIKYYLENTFYNNSPDAVFSDKKGRFFKFTWSEYNSGRNINDVSSTTGANNHIRGWYRDVSDNEWNVNELDLLNITGYDNPITGRDDNKPNKGDPRDENNGDNYNTEQDRKNFYSDSGDKTGMILGPKKRKPLRFPTGGMSKSNYIPGYIRRSIVDCNDEPCSHKFLVMDREGRNQAFVLYQKLDSGNFANDIIVNHPDLIAKIKKDLNTMQS